MWQEMAPYAVQTDWLLPAPLQGPPSPTHLRCHVGRFLLLLERLSYDSGKQDHTDHFGRSTGTEFWDTCSACGSWAALSNRATDFAFPVVCALCPTLPGPSGSGSLEPGTFWSLLAFSGPDGVYRPSVLSPPSGRVEPIGRGRCDSSITLMGGTTSG